jgi:transcriptional regulator with XRE-family HTH domain
MPEPEGHGSIGLRALGETVKRLRIERDLGPGALAFDAETSESKLTDLEKGDKEPRWGTLRRIARCLGMELPVILAKAEELEDEMRRERGD